ncbi:MAG: J domain-containing protein [Chloroherpetonaceae bacterium]|nr:J domain-containing protein [Chloroherpetonaceae bacterium]
MACSKVWIRDDKILVTTEGYLLIYFKSKVILFEDHLRSCLVMHSSYNNLNEERFKNYYEVLRIRPADSPELIRAAYIAQIKEWHPDKFQNSDPETRCVAIERSKLINEAKRNLLDPESKRLYDATFEARFPRRWEKLVSKSRPKQRQVTVEELIERGIPINPTVASSAQNADPTKFQWLNFSTRVNPRTKRVVFNLNHFLERNPECEVRLRYHVDEEWTSFTKLRVHTYQYKGSVGLAEMQARYVSPKGKIFYSKIIPKTIILGEYHESMREKEKIQLHYRKIRQRLAMKLILAILGSSLISELSDSIGIFISL